MQSDFEHFLNAQSDAYQRATTELRQGHKRTHWMWFIFPQLAGLGRSEMSKKFALASLDEAHAYANHPVLGARLSVPPIQAQSPRHRREGTGQGDLFAA